ncbi:MAG: HEAT repeat domain-containing protein [Planctomycetes bacterium]|nr:HEAT repeat domain-containing protein [Planctomycetota bacterium]
MNAVAVVLTALLGCASAARAQGVEPATGTWRAVLDTPGGELPFRLELVRDVWRWRATIVNGEERIALDAVRIDGGELRIDIPHYASRITARMAPGGETLDGAWIKRKLDGEARVPFRASRTDAPRFARERAAESSVTGRWRAHFAASGDSVLILSQDEAGRVLGTVETPLGDWRHLEGSFDGPRLRLSVFDGAHAFLLDARRDDDGTLRGGFWSGDAWHEEWTARRDDDATLPDPFAATRWSPRVSLADVVLPQVGEERDDDAPQALPLGHPSLWGRARLIVLFGSWCPNCHDEAKALADLFQRFAGRGLVITGIAFELSGEFARDATQVRRFAARHGVRWPLFLGGRGDKRAAGEAVPLLDALRAFPTTILLGADGEPRFVHSGWSGPATGPSHERLLAEFASRIDSALTEPAPDVFAPLRAIDELGESWYEHGLFAGGDLVFSIDPPREATARHRVFGSGRPVIADETTIARLAGDVLALGGRALVFDRDARVLRDPFDWGHRFAPSRGDDEVPTAPFAGDDEAVWRRMLAGASTLERREAITALAVRRGGASGSRAALDEALPLLRDQDPLVLRAAVWAIGRCHESRAIPRLVELAVHADSGVRREVARALFRMRDDEPAIGEALAKMRDDPDPAVRTLARSVDRPR